MNLKKITAMITALCSAASCAVPMVSNAKEDELSEMLKTAYSMTEVSDVDSIINKLKDDVDFTEASRVFINNFGKVLIEQRAANRINFDIKKDADFADCERIIKAICPDAIIDLNTNIDLDSDLLDSSFYYNFADNISLDDMISSDISIGQAKDIFNALNDKGYIKGFYYLADTYLESSLDYLLSSADQTVDLDGDILGSLGDLFSEADIDLSADYFSDYADMDLSSLLSGVSADALNLTPSYDFDIDDLAELADICDFKLIGSNMGGSLFTGTEIDMFNALMGDSNCDSAFDLADAVLIMQSLANPNKYSLSAQGRFNADMDDNGVTVGDAQAIQKMLLGLL